jgi:predicted Zn-dependent protease
MNSPRIEKLRALIAQDSSDELAHFMLGNEYLNAGRFREAVAALRRVVELNPDYTAGWRSLGQALTGAGSAKEAAAAYRTGIEVAERTGDLQTGKEMRVFLARLPDIN